MPSKHTPQNAHMMIKMMTNNDNDDDDDVEYYETGHLRVPNDSVPVYAPDHSMQSRPPVPASYRAATNKPCERGSRSWEMGSCQERDPAESRLELPARISDV